MVVSYLVNMYNFYFQSLQYVSATQWLEFSKRLEVNRRYRKFRPTSSVKLSVKSWWRYAYVSVLEHNIKPYSWPKIVQYKYGHLVLF